LRRGVQKEQLAAKVISHVVFWIVILLLTAPFWLPQSCMESIGSPDEHVRQVKIGGALIVGELEE